MKIPTIESIEDIPQEAILGLMHFGFCYVKLPEGKKCMHWLDQIQQQGLEFFRQPIEQKSQYSVDSDTWAGYSQRSLKNKLHFVEQAFFRPNKPLSPFQSVKHEIEKLSELFEKSIASKLLLEIFKAAKIKDPEKSLDKIMEDNFQSFSLSYYADKQSEEYEFGLKPHKDFGLITLLWITKPGLEVYYNKTWHPVDPKPGYIVVNLANALVEMLEGNQVPCESALHRVRPVSNERLSFGLFIDPSLKQPINNLTSGTQLYPDGQSYLKEQFRITYSDPLVPRSKY